MRPLSLIPLLLLAACAGDGTNNAMNRQTAMTAGQIVQQSAGASDKGQLVGTLLGAFAGTQPSAAPAVRIASAPQTARSGGGAGSPKLETGVTFFPHYIVEFWRDNPSAAPLDASPSANARGHMINPAPSVFGAAPYNRNKPGVAEMRNKLARALAEVAKNPALGNDLRGVSLSPGGEIGMRRGGPLEHVAAGDASWAAFPLNLDDPKANYRHPDGTNSRVGSKEGPTLHITVNDPAYIESSPVPVGTYNGYTIMAHGGGYGILIVTNGRPLLVGSGAQQRLNPDLIDQSRPPSEIQMLFAFVGNSSSGWRSMAQGRVQPTSGEGRLIAALFNTDWNALLNKLQ